MLTIVAINAKKRQDGTKTYFDNVSKAWSDDNVKLVHINSIKELDAPAEKTIIFHPRANHNNPEWFTEDKVEDFTKFEIPEDHYYVFGDDGGKLLEDIEKFKPEYKNSRFVKIPVSSGFRSFHAHIGAAIVLWERFKRGAINNTSIYDW